MKQNKDLKSIAEEELIAIPKTEYQRLKKIESEMTGYYESRLCELKNQIQAIESDNSLNNILPIFASMNVNMFNL